MRKFILAAAAASSRPTPPPAPPPPKLLVVISVDQFSADLFDEYRPQFTGGLRAARDGHGVPQRLSEPCRDRDLPGPFDHPDRRSPGPHRDHRQQLDRPVGRRAPTRGLLRRGRNASPGTLLDHYTVSAKHLLVPTLGDLMKARWPASRSVAVAGKDRAAVMMGGHARPALVLGRQRVRHRPRRARVPARVPKVNAAVAAALAQRGRRSSAALCQPRPRDPRRAAASRSAPAASRVPPVTRPSAPRRISTPRCSRSPPALVDDMQLGRGPRARPARDRPFGDRLCRPRLRHRGEEMCLQLLRSTASSATSSACSTAGHRLCGGADRRSWRPRHARTRATAGARRPDRSRFRRDCDRRRLGAQLGLRARCCSATAASATCLSTGTLPAPDRNACSLRAVAAYRAHPQVETVFTRAEIAATPLPTTRPTAGA